MKDRQMLTGRDPSLIAAASALRRRVFIDEQDVPEDEVFDGMDDHAVHAVILEGGDPVATARMMQDGASWQIGWVAVDKSRRDDGLGRAVVTALMDWAARHSGREIFLTAQQHALAFYEKLGFTPCGEAETLESGFVLIPMQYRIQP